ncbi:DUF3530 family protein [Shewanella sp. OMA3-2]|uniref:DUF3530 family protein n=1 Tax=Shewanella sp. OMA3-2 TaxID=2908650 RepID=UPI001F23F3BF|nr:DUF3530 family protein [Shewanella sp. OMA3-2]UJF22710.1 alpha/beta hydrolase family protein [Shewanella sp. OMA3-2]
MSPLRTWYYLLCVLFMSTSVLAQPSFAPIPATEIKKITVAEKEIDVLVRPWSGKQQFGLAIIIGPSDSQAESMGLVGFLRHQLNAKGWATVSLTPPKGLYRPNFATESEQIKKAGDAQLSLPAQQAVPKYNSAQLLELRNFQQANLTEALNQLTTISQPYPGAKIIIAFDDSAGMVTHLLFEKKIPSPELLILVNPYREYEDLIDESNQRKQIAEQLVMMSIPILDLVSPDAHPLAQANAPVRKQYNQVKPIKYYRQYQLDLTLANASGWQEALERIEGFSRSVIGR